MIISSQLSKELILLLAELNHRQKNIHFFWLKGKNVLPEEQFLAKLQKAQINFYIIEDNEFHEILARGGGNRYVCRQVRFVWLVELWFLVLLTILFNEWLLLLLELTDTHSLSVFLFFFMFVLLVSMFSWPWYVNVPIHLLAIMHILHYLYFSGPVFSMSWLYDLGEQLSYSSLLLLRWDLTQLPFEVRTLFFLLLVCGCLPTYFQIA